MNAISALCVYCGSSNDVSPVYLEQARELGRRAAESNLGIVFGGGRVGMMGALADGALEDPRSARYEGWDSELGREVMAGRRSLADLHRLVASGEIDPAPRSGRQEALENLVNRYIERVR